MLIVKKFGGTSVAKRWIKKKHPTFDGDVYVENIRCFLDISQEELGIKSLDLIDCLFCVCKKFAGIFYSKTTSVV